MKANKYENFEMEVIDRSEIHEADYNPRKITDDAFAKLKKWFKTEGKGQLAPLTVNRRTMTLVSGHQRLAVIDQLHRGKQYKLTVAMTDLDEKTEIEANIFMNNASAQGEFDQSMLEDIHVQFPEIDFVQDLGFTEADCSLLFADIFDEVVGTSQEAETLKADTHQFTQEDFRNAKKNIREKKKGENAENGSYNIEKEDFSFTVICPNNAEKHRIMKLMHKAEGEQFINSTILYDIYDHKIKLRELS